MSVLRRTQGSTAHIQASVSNKYPVLFWIFGGAYEIGSAGGTGYATYSEKYAGRGVIVVQANYRLGFFSWSSWLLKLFVLKASCLPATRVCPVTSASGTMRP